MNKAYRSFLFAILAFIAGTWLLCRPRADPSAPSGVAPQSPSPSASSGDAPQAPAPSAPSAKETKAAPSGAASAASASSSARGFRSRRALEEHFTKHGREVGASTPEAYEALARGLRDAPAGGDVLEIVRPTDGVVSRFDRRTGTFIAFDADGTIRTFFKPNDGEAYFRRQARRRPGS